MPATPTETQYFGVLSQKWRFSLFFSSCLALFFGYTRKKQYLCSVKNDFMNLDFEDFANFDVSLDGGISEEKIEKAEKFEDDIEHEGWAKKRRTTMCTTHSDRYLFRRAFSEVQLLNVFQDVNFLLGDCYHCISNGDVDSLSYLQLILRRTKIKKMVASTWCMAAEDILQFREWITSGKIRACDFYVGEIFPSTYRTEWRQINELVLDTGCGRVACFRNHSKIYAGIGDFPFVIESSANINTNPRAEQTCITISQGLVDFYFDYFGKIKTIKEYAY